MGSIPGITRGWGIGSFIKPASSPRHTKDVEVKWFTHKRGEESDGWRAGRTATTLSILISGRFRTELMTSKDARRKTIVLTRQGDYVLFRPRVFHYWRAEADTVVLTVRWPSTKDDTLRLPPKTRER
jgi:hypothetical protein